MSPEQSNKPSIREVLAGYLEKPKSTGHLMRLAKQVLRNNPKFVEQAAVSAYLNLPWISLNYNGKRYLIRFDKVEVEVDESGEKKIKESLFITKYLSDDQVESVQIVTDGLNSEQKWDGEKFVDEEIGGPIFRGVSYLKGKDIVGDKFMDERTQETSWAAEYSPPVVGKEALPHAQRILKELLQEEKAT